MDIENEEFGECRTKVIQIKYPYIPKIVVNAKCKAIIKRISIHPN